jgi:hypothetical protein
MRKEGIVVVCLFLVVVLGIGIVSAGLFDYKPFKKQPGITGQAITDSAPITGYVAYDCGTLSRYKRCGGGSKIAEVDAQGLFRSNRISFCQTWCAGEHDSSEGNCCIYDDDDDECRLYSGSSLTGTGNNDYYGAECEVTYTTPSKHWGGIIVSEWGTNYYSTGEKACETGTTQNLGKSSELSCVNMYKSYKGGGWSLSSSPNCDGAVSGSSDYAYMAVCRKPSDWDDDCDKCTGYGFYYEEDQGCTENEDYVGSSRTCSSDITYTSPSLHWGGILVTNGDSKKYNGGETACETGTTNNLGKSSELSCVNMYKSYKGGSWSLSSSPNCDTSISTNKDYLYMAVCRKPSDWDDDCAKCTGYGFYYEEDNGCTENEDYTGSSRTCASSTSYKAPSLHWGGILVSIGPIKRYSTGETACEKGTTNNLGKSSELSCVNMYKSYQGGSWSLSSNPSCDSLVSVNNDYAYMAVCRKPSDWDDDCEKCAGYGFYYTPSSGRCTEGYLTTGSWPKCFHKTPSKHWGGIIVSEWGSQKYSTGDNACVSGTPQNIGKDSNNVCVNMYKSYKGGGWTSSSVACNSNPSESPDYTYMAVCRLPSDWKNNCEQCTKYGFYYQHKTGTCTESKVYGSSNSEALCAGDPADICKKTCTDFGYVEGSISLGSGATVTNCIYNLDSCTGCTDDKACDAPIKCNTAPAVQECFAGTKTCYVDNDGDDYGQSSMYKVGQATCSTSNKDSRGNIYSSERKGDCNDGASSSAEKVNPGVDEKCDSNDWNCDGSNTNGATCSSGKDCVNEQCVSNGCTEDETTTTSCTRGKGECERAGVLVKNCEVGTFISSYCNAELVTPGTESCNGDDDNCDGTPDNGLGSKEESCTSQGGKALGDETHTCQSGDWVGDGDCDIDDCVDGWKLEGSSCVEIENCDSLTKSCTRGKGECRRTGTQTGVCSGGTVINYGSCSVSAGSQGTETCNNKDDDCDGSTDEDLTKCEGEVYSTCSSGSWDSKGKIDGKCGYEDTVTCDKPEHGWDWENNQCVEKSINAACSNTFDYTSLSACEAAHSTTCTKRDFTGYKWQNDQCVADTRNNLCTRPTNFEYDLISACIAAHPTTTQECFLLEDNFCLQNQVASLCSQANAYATAELCEVDIIGDGDTCGNNQVEATEVCDGELSHPTFAAVTCESLGFGPGTLGCKDDCAGWDTSGCSLECHDTDDGINVTNKAKVNFNGNEYYDGCSDEGFVLEQFCINVLTVNENREEVTVFGKAEKAFFCPRGNECFEGACVDKSDIPRRPECTEEADCTKADETCVEGKCVEVVDVADENYCENNVCFFDKSFDNGVKFEYGNAEYYITYFNSTSQGVYLRIGEVKDREGEQLGARIEAKELKRVGTINHIMGLAIDVLESSNTAAKIEIVQFSCKNEELCLGNFECSALDVCATPGDMCIIDDDCNAGEDCDAGICIGEEDDDTTTQTTSTGTGDGTTSTVQNIPGICRLQNQETVECTYQDIAYSVEREAGCNFVVTASSVSEVSFNLAALQRKVLENGISVKRDVNRCSSQYLALRFESGTSTTTGTTTGCQADDECSGSKVCVEGSCVTQSQATELDNLFCVYGCFEDSKCYPVGYRKGDKYCGIDNSFLTQRDSERTPAPECDNSFECSSNLCLDGECVSSSFIRKIGNFFKGLFGSN